MKKIIKVPFAINDVEMEVTLFYSTELEGNKHTIDCKVDVDNFDANLWHWLEARSFQLRSMLFGDEYAQLYTENDNINSKDTMRFIECAYWHIMTKEQLPMVSVE